MKWQSKIAAFSIVAMSVASAAAAPQTWTGKISDAMCAKSGGKHTGDPKDCIDKCIKGGDNYVLVVNDKIYAISNQKFEDLKKFAGDVPVVVTGDLKEDTITVTKIAASKPAK
jgi:hypothetical protein